MRLKIFQVDVGRELTIDLVALLHVAVCIFVETTRVYPHRSLDAIVLSIICRTRLLLELQRHRVVESIHPYLLGSFVTDELKGAYNKLLQLWGGLDQVSKANEMPGIEVE